MAARRWIPALLIAGGFFAASAATAQFVPFTRCHGAYPCNVPFVIQYRPDPLIAGPYPSAPSSSAVSAHVALKSRPEIELDTPAPLPLSEDPVDASVRAFLKRYPAFKPSTAKAGDGQPEAKAAPAPAPPKPQ
jgi:hypothetical protein